MKPIFDINFGRIPIYQIMLAIAMISAVIMFESALKKQGGFSTFMKRKVNRSMIIGGLAGLAGANVINWFCYPDLLDASLYERVMTGGFSSFFAILIFLGVSALVLRINRVDVRYCLNLAIKPILLAQLIGRVGCLLRGCCWGKTVEIAGHSFSFPVRELEMIFALSLLIIFSKRFFGKRLQIYLVAYPAFRFVIDFFRGEASGALFGIDLLTPVQLVALVLLVVLGIILVVKSIRKEFKHPAAEGAQPQKQKYEPLPNYYQEPVGTKHTGRTVAGVICGVLIAASLLIYFNPFHLSAFDNLRLGVTNTVSSLFAKKGRETELGQSNGVSLKTFDEKTQISDAEAARVKVEGSEKWNNFKYSCLKEGTLDDGGKYYVLYQTVNGIPVLGRARVLVTDAENNARFIIGDDADLSYSNKILKNYTCPILTGTGTAPTLSTAFPGKNELSRREFLYDTGDGLVRVYHVILTADGTTPGLGVVIDAETERVITVTPPETGLMPNIRRAEIITAGENVLALVSKNDSKEIDRLSQEAKARKKQTASAEAPDLATDAIEAGLCRAITNSGLDNSVIENILRAANQIAAALPSVNENQYREIIAAETESALLEQGKTASEAEKTANKVRKGFETAGISQDSDENALQLEVTEKKTKFKHSIDYTGDSDIFEVAVPAKSTVEIQISTKTPLEISYTSEDTGITVSQYVESNETITFYPEDGSTFRMRVSDSSDPYAMRSGSAPYTITVKAEKAEEEVPSFITTTLSRICDAYERSNLASFLSMVEDPDYGEISAENAAGLEMLMLSTDSCAGCCGMGEGMDAAKGVMAFTLMPEGTLPEEQMYTLRGSSLSLKCAQYVDKGEYWAVKARMQLSQDGVDLYNGYILMRFDPINEENKANSSSSKVPESLKNLLSFFQDNKYKITQLNTPELYGIFGEEEASSDLESLYSLWNYTPYEGDGFATTLIEIDEARLAAMNVSPDKAEAFRKYTARQNLIRLKQERATLEMMATSFEVISTGGKAAKDIYDVCTNPLGFAGDKLFGNNEFWLMTKLLTNPEGLATDLVLTPLLEEFGKEADNMREKASAYDSLIAKYEAEVYGK